MKVKSPAKVGYSERWYSTCCHYKEIGGGQQVREVCVFNDVLTTA